MKYRTYTCVEMRDKVVPDLPDNSAKEHLSIVNCGHDVGSGRSAMEGREGLPEYLETPSLSPGYLAHDYD